MEATIVKTSDATVYIHDDDCNSDMNAVVQEVTGIIFDVYKRKNEVDQSYKQSSGNGSSQ